MDRTKTGKFAPGNRVSRLGWQGLVNKRFAGNKAAARAYVAQLGRWSYAKQAVGGTRFEYRLQTVWPHPGTPEQFLKKWEGGLNSIAVSNSEAIAF